jgi:hypothetical protein
LRRMGKASASCLRSSPASMQAKRSVPIMRI